MGACQSSKSSPPIPAASLHNLYNNTNDRKDRSKPPSTIEDELSNSAHDPEKSTRQKLAWHRDGIPVTDVYEILEIIGQGSMGEVTLVQKKVDSVLTAEKRLEELERRVGGSDIEKRRRMGSADDGECDDSNHDNVEGNLEEITTFAKALEASKHTKLTTRREESYSSSSTSSTTDSETDSKQQHTRRKYACKTVNTLRMKDHEIREFLNEIDILRDLDHPNIVQLFEIYRVKRKLWIITELCAGGDLSSRINTMTEADVAVVLEQMLRAVRYMHKRNVCHRDIKLENVMYADGDVGSDIKLIDFGLSNKFTKGVKMLKACGTVYTAAPELVLGRGYTEMTDIWSIGVVTFILLSKEYPFLKDMEEMEDEVKRDNLLNARYDFGNSWKELNITQQGMDFVTNCLKKEPYDRWSAREALDYVQDVWIPHLESLTAKGNSSGLICVEPDHNLDIFDVPPSLKPEMSPEYPTADTPQNSSSDILTIAETHSFSSPSLASMTDEPLNRSTAAIRKRTKMNSKMLQGMQTFALYGELKKTILMTMAYTMDKSGLHELREMFTVLDSEGNGTVSLTQLKTALKSLHNDKHLDDSTIEKLFHSVDLDRSGQIHYNEFLAAIIESQGLITMEHLADAFDRLDSTGKGYISKKDLLDLLGSDYDEKEVDRMICEADYKKNGRVDYDEFLRLMFEDPGRGMGVMGETNLFEDQEMAQNLGTIESGGTIDVEEGNDRVEVLVAKR